MRREDDVVAIDAQMIGYFRRVPVRKQSVGAQIFVHFDKVQLALGFLPCSRRAGLAIANYAALFRDPAGLDERPQAENHAGRITAGIGDQARAGQLIGIKFRQTVNGFFGQFARRRRQFVPLRECFRIVEAERAAQVHHPHACVQKLRHKFKRRFVRRGEKYCSRTARGHGIHRKSLAGRFAPAPQTRENFRQTLHLRGSLAQVEGWFLNFRVPKEQLGQLETCIARRSDYGDPLRVTHRSRSSIRFWTAARAWREGVITKTVSSPAIVPATSLNFSASSAAASGCAPEGGVFSTSRLNAGRRSTRNSRRARPSGGKGVEASSPLASGL